MKAIRLQSATALSLMQAVLTLNQVSRQLQLRLA